MTGFVPDRIVRLLGEAEGYLDLGLPDRALGILQSRSDWASMLFEASFLTGRALRVLGRHRDALKPLETAWSLRPGDVGVAMALGWCYKRTQRLAQAIDALERSAKDHPQEPLLRYNLACYWSLAADPPKALAELTKALELDPGLGRNLDGEPDFRAIRDHEEFRRLARAEPAQA